MQATASPDERRSFILKALQETGRLTTAQLSSHFDISEDSARRDFRELSAEGMIQRVHGAALPATSASQPFKSRYKVSSGTKARLAKLAAARIREGQVVLFDGGTTNLAVANQISKTLAFSAITSSPQIATALSESRNVEVILLGGVFDPRSQMTVGSAVLDAVQRIRADVCFTGVHGLDAENGLTTPYYDEALTKAAMIAASSVVIAVATNDKIGFCAAHKISELDSVDLLIAERSESAHTQLEEIEHCGVEVVLG
ncbi:putative HTH-type transcriptional regulator, deoR family [Phaeobacter inhibens]|uniref:HTH-type transcriptional regulator, deoR family n=2 Tax=Phaeobacter inhibens TaxID=221822 RepID=A0ABN5GKN5_9RHOB|nr:DeoR/GlpR family DNA-binding transcription regulator [Phaeobacter inhibens]AUQ49470.1 putative HTH-type transcriptional regulator, deoR family [Phaeobacter inhibens]AUQ94025.1 putative HTH-type transcriptional regulator, deoR family [Phaeobacter inhibens]AUR19273.1 putative HTH-type transcriptional regulator, deoR family [Phaeobacter inhibens]